MTKAHVSTPELGDFTVDGRMITISLIGICAIDPLEIIFVREVMRTNMVVLSPTFDKNAWAALRHVDRLRQRLFPVVDAAGRFVGLLTSKDLPPLLAECPAGASRPGSIGILSSHVRTSRSVRLSIAWRSMD